MDIQSLFQAARAVQKNAYAPYSNFSVGAALLGESGQIFTGCNVENISYPLGLCAERSAVASMIAAGERKIKAIAVCVPEGIIDGSPCGGCRQVLWEFCTVETLVYVIQPVGDNYHLWTLGDLLPFAFKSLTS